MNIFWLSFIVSECARFHCDKHVVKMILETTQLLFTAHHLTQSESNWIETYKKEIGKDPYKPTHKNHPCSIWARKSTANYNWLCKLGLELCKEYTRRYSEPNKPPKKHTCEAYLTWLKDHTPPIEKQEFTVPPMAMPVRYQRISKKKNISSQINSVINSYRAYYCGSKAKFCKWNKGRDPTPTWFGGALALSPVTPFATRKSKLRGVKEGALVLI